MSRQYTENQDLEPDNKSARKLLSRNRYSLYGLNVESDLSLPCPGATGKNVDLKVKLRGPLSSLSKEDGSRFRTWVRMDAGWLLRYCNLQGECLECRYETDGSTAFLAHYGALRWDEHLMIVLGPVMAAALQLKGIPILHGGAVVINGGAVLILGESELGKSTLTAALNNVGYPLLCEELVTLSQVGGSISVQPGHPLIKLSPESVRFLGKNPDELSPVFPSAPEFSNELWFDSRQTKGGFNSTPLPLRAIYLLSGRCPEIREPVITPLAPSAACLAIGNHIYGRSWLDTSTPDKKMRLCASIAASAPVRRILSPEGLESVSSVISALAENACSASSAAKPWPETGVGV